MENILPFINTLGLTFGALYLIYKEIKSGSWTITKEVADSYKERNTQLDQTIKDMQTKFDSQIAIISQELSNTRAEQSRLKGVLEEKDKHILTLTQLVQGRNPEMLEVLQEIKGFMKSLNDKMTTSSNVLDYQTKILEGGQTRNEAIDKASHDLKGDPVRVPLVKSVSS